MVEVWDAHLDCPTHLLTVLAHLHSHFSCEGITLYLIDAAIGVDAVQTEGAPVLCIWTFTSVPRVAASTAACIHARQGRARWQRLTLESLSMMMYLNGTSMKIQKTHGL